MSEYDTVTIYDLPDLDVFFVKRQYDHETFDNEANVELAKQEMSEFQWTMPSDVIQRYYVGNRSDTFMDEIYHLGTRRILFGMTSHYGFGFVVPSEIGFDQQEVLLYSMKHQGQCLVRRHEGLKREGRRDFSGKIIRMNRQWTRYKCKTK